MSSRSSRRSHVLGSSQPPVIPELPDFTVMQNKAVDRLTDFVLSKLGECPADLILRIKEVLAEVYYRGVLGASNELGVVSPDRVLDIQAAFRDRLSVLGVVDRRTFQIEVEGREYQSYAVPRMLAPLSASEDPIACAISGGHGVPWPESGAVHCAGNKRRTRNVPLERKGDMLFGELDEAALRQELREIALHILDRIGISDRASLIYSPQSCSEIIEALRNGFGGTNDPLYIMLKHRNRRAFFSQYYRRSMLDSGQSEAQIARDKKTELAEFMFPES